MKKIFYFTTFFALLTQLLFAQIQSVTAFADYSIALSKRMTTTNATAVGGGIKIKYKIFDNFNLGLVGGYKLYSVNEPDVLKTWGWQFWADRYYTKILSDLQADPNLSVQIGAEQKMDLLPLILFIDYSLAATQKLKITPSFGGGVYFYTRRMFAIENWSKDFPSANYVFNYSYRNFAPAKRGNPIFINSSLEIVYKILTSTNIYSNVNFNYVIPTKGSMGYDAFPFENELAFNIGIEINY